VSAKLIAAFVVVAGLGDVSFLSNARIGSMGATRLQRWFDDPSRPGRTELWPIVPMFTLVGVFLLVLLWPWFVVLVAPIVVLSHRYAGNHESPIRRARRASETSE
jgi:hypothetical protein